VTAQISDEFRPVSVGQGKVDNRRLDPIRAVPSI
jgi:hypothetical protein